MLHRAFVLVIAVTYLMCVLYLSGLQKEDLDVNMLKKLQRHNVNIDDMNSPKLGDQCRPDLKIAPKKERILNNSKFGEENSIDKFIDINKNQSNQPITITHYFIRQPIMFGIVSNDFSNTTSTNIKNSNREDNLPSEKPKQSKPIIDKDIITEKPNQEFTSYRDAEFPIRPENFRRKWSNSYESPFQEREVNKKNSDQLFTPENKGIHEFYHRMQKRVGNKLNSSSHNRNLNYPEPMTLGNIDISNIYDQPLIKSFHTKVMPHNSFKNDIVDYQNNDFDNKGYTKYPSYGKSFMRDENDQQYKNTLYESPKVKTENEKLDFKNIENLSKAFFEFLKKKQVQARQKPYDYDTSFQNQDEHVKYLKGNNLHNHDMSIETTTIYNFNDEGSSNLQSPIYDYRSFRDKAIMYDNGDRFNDTNKKNVEQGQYNYNEENIGSIRKHNSDQSVLNLYNEKDYINNNIKHSTKDPASPSLGNNNFKIQENEDESYNKKASIKNNKFFENALKTKPNLKIHNNSEQNSYDYLKLNKKDYIDKKSKMKETVFNLPNKNSVTDDFKISPELIKQIAESVKFIVLNDFSKNISTTIKNILTTTTTTSTESNIPTSPVSKSTAKYEPNKIVEAASAIERFIALMDEFKYVNSSATTDQSLINKLHSGKINPFTNIYNNKIKKLIQKSAPIIIQTAPNVVNPYNKIEIERETYPYFQVQRNELDIRSVQGKQPLTIQTNMDFVPPLPVRVFDQFRIVQNIIMTPSPNFRSKDMFNNFKIREEMYNDNEDMTNLKNSRIQDSYHNIDYGKKYTKNSDLRHEVYKPLIHNRHHDTNDYNIYNQRHKYGVHSQYVNKYKPKFHEKLEGDLTSPMRYNQVKLKPEDNYKINVASRNQVPLNTNKTPAVYDDAHFKNFLNNQQKVNDMLEKILASKSKTAHDSGETI